MTLNLFAIPPGAPFLETLARGWLLQRGDDPLAIATGLILTPTRRAARSLAEAFLRVTTGRGLLLPRIVALGALDERPLALEGALDLPPAVDPPRRLAVLAHLILRLNGAGGAPRTADRAWVLAGELAALMDDADRAEIDLAAKLPDATDPVFSAHWSRTLEFLRIVTHAWPDWLAENGVMNPAARQMALLDAQARAWEMRPPDFPVVIAGTTAGIPAVARLARVVARLPEGRVVLPVLDTLMNSDAWAAMDDTHPQAGLAHLLSGLDATRDDVQLWDTGQDTSLAWHPGWNRFATLSRALLPADALSVWQDPHIPQLDGLWRLTPRNQQEEAEAIAMILREAVETPGRTAALVTPDRELAERVVATLPRHGIIADDSAGEKLSDTPPAVFLRLLARAVTENLAPVPLLAVLKHPLAAAGLAPATCRQLARELEIAALRGPRPIPGITGLRQAVEHSGADLKAFLGRIESRLEPVLRVATVVEIPPGEALSAIIAAAENLATTDDEPGAARLWAAEEGDALASALTSALGALSILPDQKGEVIPGLLDALLAGQMVRSRRALRGRGGAEHPRVFIWGPLEARLQKADVIVLGGLIETVWPPAPEPGPWLSRSMRATVGLPSPETQIGLAAHDFLAAAMAAPEVVLSSPDRREGAPAIPARWLTRLKAMLDGGSEVLRTHPAVEWARSLDLSAGGPNPVSTPRPCPPVAARPSRLSVTEIETWLRDPYAIYAKHILKLIRLADLDEETDAADYGTLVHAGLSIFFREHGVIWPPDAGARMRGAMARALAESLSRAALAAWWEPRLERIADWVVATETQRRANIRVVAIRTEASGSLAIQRPTRRFTLTARADRIERRADERLAVLDYKTGQAPSKKDVERGLAPQLPLEAAIAAEGGFGPDMHAATAELIYWKLTGAYEPGKAIPLFEADDVRQAVIDNALSGLKKLIDEYDRPDQPYLAHPHPSWVPRFSTYAKLARVAEWSLTEGDGEADAITDDVDG